MTEWTIRTVAELAASAPSAIAIGPFGSRLTADKYTKSGVPVVRGQNITQAKYLDERDLVYIPEPLAETMASCVVRPGDLVFPHRGAIGRVGLVTGHPWMLSTSMMKVTVDRSVAHPDFIFYYFRGPGRELLLQHASVVGTPGIAQPLTALRGIAVRLPPLSEQHAIAEVLGVLDERIESNRDSIAKMGQLAAASCAAAGRYVRLDSLASQAKAQLRPDQFNEVVSHFSLPAFDDSATPSTENPSEIKSNKFLVAKPSVLVSKLNPRIPRLWDVSTLPEHMAIASTEFIVLEPRGISSTVLWALLEEGAVMSILATKVAGTSGSHQRIKVDDVMALQVRDPILLGERVQSFVTDLGRLIHLRRVESMRLTETRNALLPLLMAGRIRVTDAEKVVEEVV